MSKLNDEIRCNKCYEIPQIELIPKNGNLCIKKTCFCGQKILSFNTFKNNIVNIDFSNLFCFRCNKKIEKDNQKIFYFNKQYKKIICNNCKVLKMFNEKDNINLLNFDENCFNHQNNKNNFFCLNCKINFCNECLNLHNNHEIKDYSKINFEKNYYFNLKNSLENTIKEKQNYYELIKKEILKKYQFEINLIEKSFKNNEEINNLIINILKKLFSIYENKVNYSTIMNIKNNTYFNKKQMFSNKFHYYNKNNNINYKEIIKYYNNNFLISHFDHEMKCDKNIKAHESPVNKLLELNNKNLISCSFDGYLKIFNKNLEEIYKLLAHSHSINNMNLFDDDKKLITCSSDKILKIWEINENKINILYALNNHSEKINDAIYIKKKNIIISCSKNEIIIWNYLNLNKEEKIIQTINESSFGILNFNNEKIITYNIKKIFFWEFDNNKKLNLISTNEKLNSYSNDMCKKLDNNNIIMVCNNVINVINVNTYQIVTIIKNEMGMISSFILMKNKTIVVSQFDCVSQIEINEFYNLKIIKNFRYSDYDDYYGCEDDNHINSMTELNNGKIAICYRNSFIEIWKNGN